MNQLFKLIIHSAAWSRRMILFTIFVFPFFSFSQSFENKFIDALVNNRENITDYIDNDELERSRRLGIEYIDVKNKFLISFDIPDFIKADFRMEKYTYSLQTQQLEDGFSVITLAIPSSSYLQKFYFLNDKFVPPSGYFAGKWEQKQSKYFNFKISEPKYFNDYCIKRLDDFVDMVADTLGFTAEERTLLESKKLDYILCKNEDEVEKITGYKSKGQAVLAYDEVVTAYQTHFHEVTHLLINYKLKRLGLYTLPFFMEGFAVAMGGRGGLAPRVVTDIGYFLQISGFMTCDSIITYDAFYSQDASMAYALSGLYNSFLISYLGSENYLSLYKKLNGNIDYIKGIELTDLALPAAENFNAYLEKYGNEKIFYVDPPDTIKPPLHISGFDGGFALSGMYYKFFISHNFFIGPAKNEYENKIYSTLAIALRSYNNDDGKTNTKYCITADSISIQIHNLFNEELIFYYNRNFSLTNIKVPSYNDFKYTFFIRKDVFYNDMDGEIVSGGIYR